MRRLLTTLLLLGLIQIVSGQGSNSQDSTIYKVIIRHVMEGRRKSDPAVVIFKKTERDNEFGIYEKDLSRLGRQAVWYNNIFLRNARYDSVIFEHLLAFENAKDANLEIAPFSMATKVSWLSRGKYDRLSRRRSDPDAFWRFFGKHYKGASRVFAFSSVYYSPDSTFAVLTYSTRCAGLSGGGQIVVLKNIRDSWEIILEEGLWAS
ncbi:MAG: hypothetical protein EOP04_08670 [Proteobacteria bacterium]|nr:MAG: hypothetical protein EOP04_08670 [Pseudomonadota bacterium]